MDKSLINKAKWNVLSSYVNFGITTLLAFFIQPLLIHFLGNTSFGVLKQIQKLMDFASIADGQASQALKWIIANKNKASKEEKQQAIGSALKIWLYFFPLLLIGIAVVIYILPFSIHNLDENLTDIVRIAGIILGMNIVLNPLFSIPDAVLVGINETHKSTFIKTFWHIISTLLMIYVAYLGYGIIGIVLVTLAISLLIGLTTLLVCKFSVSWFGIKKPEKQQFRSFFNYSFWTLIWTFVIRLFLAEETLLIGWLMGAEEVTKYTITAYIYVTALSVTLMTASAAMPGLGNVFGKQDFATCKKIIGSVREINLFIVSVFACLILLLNKNFVTLWMDANYYMGDWINLLIVVVMVQLTIIRNEGQIQDISLKIKGKVLYGLLGAILGMVLGVVLYKITQRVETIFIGLIIGRSFTYLKFPALVNRIFKVKNNHYKKIFSIVLLLVICFVSGKYIPLISSWAIFITYAVVCVAFILAINVCLLLSKENRKMLLRQ
jgi:O-antigen/teichoic acid export membrane protein